MRPGIPTRYWLLKGNPKWFDWDRYFLAGRQENWRTRFAQPELEERHRLFFWESGSARRIVGFGEVTRPVFRIDEDGNKIFRVKYLTGRLEWMPGIELLKSQRALRKARFLKPGLFGTVYPLTASEAVCIYQLAIAGNPNENIWRDIHGGEAPTSLPDIDLFATEGTPKLVAHLRRERNPGLARKKKDEFRAQNGRLFCECCRSEFAFYGTKSDSVFEVHHRRPLGSVKRAIKTTLKDLAVLCSNCHRAIHRYDPMISAEALRRMLKSGRSKE